MTATLITRPALATRWGKSIRTITRLQEARPAGFPTPIELNGRWHFRTADVEAFERQLAGSLRGAA